MHSEVSAERMAPIAFPPPSGGPASAPHDPQSTAQLMHVSPALHVPSPHAEHEPQSAAHVEHVSPVATTHAPLPQVSTAGAQAEAASAENIVVRIVVRAIVIAS